MTEELYELLTKLLDSVYSMCRKVMAKRQLTPQIQPFYKYKLKDFTYDDSGTHIQSWESELVLRKSWYSVLAVIEQRIKKLSLYNSTLDKIRTKSGLRHVSSPDYFLSQVVRIIAQKTLADEITDKSELESYVLSIIRDLNDENQTYSLVARLNGVILQPNSIKINGNTLLRKPTHKDIETEYPADSSLLATHQELEIPSAILQLTGISPPTSLYGKASKESQNAIAVLSLFRTGGIEDISWTTRTDSLSAMGPVYGKKLSLTKHGSYLIKNEDAEPLKTFWANMKQVNLPIPHAGGQKELDEVSIAYERYNDSLEGGIIEKRISSAVMGLEALYLTELDELPYRLSMRVNKLLSLTENDYKLSEVRDKVKDAYKIRSKYVHGTILKAKDKRKLEEKYGDLNEFAKRIIDYLRASIVALLKRPNKNSLIQKIDDSFLDSKKEEEIKKLLFIPY